MIIWYKIGSGVEQDDKKAVGRTYQVIFVFKFLCFKHCQMEWFESAAHNGDGTAAMNLARIYGKELGDMEEVFYLLHSSGGF